MSIAVDLDGTLMHNNGEPINHFGPLVPAMEARVRQWIAEGQEVLIFTARVHQSGFDPEIIKKIEDWTEQTFGKRLRVTGIKECGIQQIWDDRAVAVERNTGRILGGA
jgi:hypothetical protein